MTWTISRNQLSQLDLLNAESLFSLGNGYLGVRGNFEEGYGEGKTSIRGTYINAFHDIIDIAYGEKLYAFPETQQKLVNIIDAQSIELFFGEEEEKFSLFEGEVLSYERKLHLDKGYSERLIRWRSPKGKEVTIHFRRLVSFTTRELFVIDIEIESINFNGVVKVRSTINGDVTNFIDPKDPRVGSSHARLLHVRDVGETNQLQYVLNETYTSGLKTACVSRHTISLPSHEKSVKILDKSVEIEMVFNLTKPVEITKWNVYTETLRHKEDIINNGIEIHERLNPYDFKIEVEKQQTYLNEFWATADIHIEGEGLQEGIRFNLYQLLQSVGKDPYSNISAKGLSGEGYEGHYFWDTEIYIFPVFLMVQPEIAKQLLRYRYSILDSARERAKEMGHRKGALFPWRTISGKECSSFFPAGTAQYHISGDIAYSYIQYYLVTKDDQFMKQYGAEVLFETARLWLDMGHYAGGQFRIDAVTGPDEYTCIVNNNYYTNVLAKHNLKWAVKTFRLLQQEAEWIDLCRRLDLSEDEVLTWERAAEKMYLPYDEKLKINPQDDTFLKKAVWDFDSTPEENYPLLLHYHPLTLYRYQVCKQADTVLAHFLLEDEQSLDTIKNSFDYYEKITTHDSSLSSCIFSIMASKIGYEEKAYDYFIETARLDLDNTHGNTKDGLHMANMGGTWMSIVFGFGGLRIKETGLSLAPIVPKDWKGYTFHVKFQGCEIAVNVKKEKVVLTLTQGEALNISLFNEKISITREQTIERKLKP